MGLRDWILRMISKFLCYYFGSFLVIPAREQESRSEP